MRREEGREGEMDKGGRVGAKEGGRNGEGRDGGEGGREGEMEKGGTEGGREGRRN